MNTGKTWIFALIFLALALAFSTPTLPSVLAEDLRISLVDYSPKPVMPGSFFAATFRIENTAGINLTNVKVQVDAGSSFFVEGDDDISISLLEAGKSTTATFTLGVRDTASSGFETLSVDWDTPSDDGSESFSIQVKAFETKLVVESVESVPQQIAPGQEATVKLVLRNNANLLLKDVKIKLNLNSADLPFAPLGSVTEKNIDSMSAGSSREIEFKLIALADASSRIYKVPLEVNYFDEFGNEFQSQDVISLIVGSKPLLDINIEKSELVEARRGKLTIEIVNSGLTDAKFLNARLLLSDTYDVLSSQNVYVGSVDSDDIESIDFELLTKRAGTINLPLQINYRDANNKQYSEILSVQARVYSLDEAKKLGIVKTNSTFTAFVVIIAALILYFWIRKFFKARRHRAAAAHASHTAHSSHA